ncbi:MAG: hypothetical protein NVSMB14_16940 [Isosphaeraceae bacterium]
MVEVQSDHFPADAEDTTILDGCGRNDWIYVAKDLAILKNPAELRALEEARVHAVFLYGRRRSADWMIGNLRIAKPAIVSTLSNAIRPLHLAVKGGGGVEILN